MTELVVTGAGGLFGSVLMRVLAEQRRASVGFVSEHGPRPHFGKVIAVDLLDAQTYQDRLFALAPKVIVHLAAVSQIAAAYQDPERAHRVNVEATARLLSVARGLGARFVYASTDLVFDGERAPYDENAATEPCSIYGRTKLEGECHVLTYDRGLVARFPLMYGVPDATRPPSFFETLLASLLAGRTTTLFTDEVRSALWLDDAARACVTLADSSLTGVIHVGGPERLSRYQLGEQLARALGLGTENLRPASVREADAPEPRARDVSLDSSRYQAHFRTAPGRTLQEALPKILMRRASSQLS